MNGPEIVIIAAVGRTNRVIGKGLQLPWHIPEDLKRFKRMTLGHPMLMGRRTFDSLVAQVGGPLKGRRNIVITRSVTYEEPEGVEVYRSFDEAEAAVQDEQRFLITGGASIYRYYLKRAHRMELTLVDGDHEGDVFFPPFEHLVGTRYRITNEDRREGFTFVTYEAGT